MSVMSSSLLLRLCPACLVRLIWIVLEMRGKWPYRCCFLGCCFQDLFNIARSILVQFPSSFFSIRFNSSSMWCIRTVVFTQPLLERNTVLFYQIDQTSIWSITYQYQSTPSLGVYWHHFKYMRHCCRGTWICLLISENHHLEGRWHLFD